MRIEFYGVARTRAGVDALTIDAPAEGTTLGDVLRILAARFPALEGECIEGAKLARGYVANVSGERFTTSPGEALPSDCTLLILSSDAGG